MEIYIATDEERHISDQEARARSYSCAWAACIEREGRTRTQAGYLTRSNHWDATMRAIRGASRMIGTGNPGEQQARIHLSVTGDYLPHIARKIVEDPEFARQPEFAELVRELTDRIPGLEFAKANHRTMREPGWQMAQGAATAALMLRGTPGRDPGPQEEVPRFEHGRWLTDLTLDYYDGPKLMLRRDPKGRWYLAWWNGCQGYVENWLYLRASVPRMEEILEGKVTAREALENPEDGFLLAVSDPSDFRLEASRVEPHELDPDSLPVEGARLNLEAPSELYDL